MKLRIDCPDGMPDNTKITDEHGNEVENVVSVEIKIDADHLAIAIVTLDRVSFDVTGEARERLRALADETPDPD